MLHVTIWELLGYFLIMGAAISLISGIVGAWLAWNMAHESGVQIGYGRAAAVYSRALETAVTQSADTIYEPDFDPDYDRLHELAATPAG